MEHNQDVFLSVLLGLVLLWMFFFWEVFDKIPASAGP